MFTLLLLLACDVENYTIEPPTNPLAIDDDGDGYSEFMGDKDDTDPEHYPYSETYENEAYLEQSCSPVDVNITSEQAVNTINLEPVIDVAVDNPQPVVENNVTVDLTELAKTLDGITTVLQQLNTTLQGSNHNVNINSEAEATIAIEGGGYEQREYFQKVMDWGNAECVASTINNYSRDLATIVQNDTEDIIIITTLIGEANENIDVYYNDTRLNPHLFKLFMGSGYSNPTINSPFVTGNARFVINPGDTLRVGCTSGNNSALESRVIVMGYYLY
jgi:hypothetical protein